MSGKDGVERVSVSEVIAVTARFSTRGAKLGVNDKFDPSSAVFRDAGLESSQLFHGQDRVNAHVDWRARRRR